MKSIITRIAVALLPLLVSLSAIAQQSKSTQPPAPTVPENPPVWIYIVTTAIVAGAIIFISIMPSNRSQNQD
jgi:hypothetical protein